MTSRISDADRILRWSIPVPESGCWLWMGSVDPEGYPKTGGHPTGHLAAHERRAHRVSYEAFVGPIPAGMLVCHRCDVSSCVNPRHLFLGTAKDNMRDMVAKGRCKSGKTRPLTAEAKQEIRTSTLTCKAIAAQFGISARTVRAVRNSL